VRVWPYHYASYDSKGRFCSYWHQIEEILWLEPKEVLEVGIGSGFVSEYLKKLGVKIVTLDIDKRLNPDFVGSVLELPFADESFEAVACFELLEHLPYQDFSQALSEILRVSKSYAILSLPDINTVYRIDVQVPKLGEIKKLVSLSRIKKFIPWLGKKPAYVFNGEHYWEIGYAGYPLSKVTADIEKAGCKIQNMYKVFEEPLHRFFILKKTKSGNYGKNK
jgi:ubiquinone/menaquinone biosynthesis C-methylase UbiE